MPLDTVEGHEAGPDQTGPPAAPRKSERAAEDRLYETSERSRVLVHKGMKVPGRLAGLSYRPARLEGGRYVGTGKARK